MRHIFYVCIVLMLCTAALAVDFSQRRFLWQPRDTACTEPGQIVCTSKCSEVSLCLGNGDNGYTTTPVEVCGQGQKCSATAMACVDAAESDCHAVDGGFTCHATGYLPDPYNCTVYHICLTLGEAPTTSASCTGDWAYDPLTTECSLTKSDRVCTEGPVPVCQQIGQSGAIPENKIIYYICMREGGELIPYLYKCPHGQIWDESHYQCVDSF